jgi:group I intron endonuclease
VNIWRREMAYKIGDWIPLLDCGSIPDVSGLYIIRNIKSNKEYVGQSKSVRLRLKSHLSKANLCITSSILESVPYIYRAMIKHGLQQFECCLYIEAECHELSELERLLIEERNVFGKSGYNMTEGGEGTYGRLASEETKLKIGLKHVGKVMSNQTREKMRKTHTGSTSTQEAREAIRLSHLGTTMSEETKEKIRNSLRGRVISEETREKLKLRVYSESARRRMSASSKGRVHSEQTRSKISFLNVNL